MANHQLFFTICLTTLLYIGCHAGTIQEPLKHEDIHSLNVPGTGTDPSSKSPIPPTPTPQPDPKNTTSLSTTTHGPPPNVTTTTPPQTTTSSPPPETTTLTPNSTTHAPTPAPTSAPTTPAPTPPKHDRSFDLPSFIGGVILSLGLAAISYVVYKFYRTRTDPNYRTL